MVLAGKINFGSFQLAGDGDERVTCGIMCPGKSTFPWWTFCNNWFATIMDNSFMLSSSNAIGHGDSQQVAGVSERGRLAIYKCFGYRQRVRQIKKEFWCCFACYEFYFCSPLDCFACRVHNKLYRIMPD